MNQQSLVSIVTIFLNGEPFIEDAIKSAIAQTYELGTIISG
jgi:glycosyltransferase involved in cell wall biosynthesis